MKYSKCLMLTTAILMIGCTTADKDMQGTDPSDFYSQHPIENKVETRRLVQIVHFVPGESALSGDDEDKLADGLRAIQPLAVDSIVVRTSPSDKFGLARETALGKLISRMGYGKTKVRFEPSKDVKSGTASIDVAYLVVVPPDCPDWRMSPVTSYSNTWQGNFYCATETNIGLMVADPHDLVRGTGDVTPDTERGVSVIQDYNTNKDYMPNTLSAGTTSGSSGGSSSSSSGSSSSSSSGSSGSSSGGGGGSSGSSGGR